MAQANLNLNIANYAIQLIINEVADNLSTSTNAGIRKLVPTLREWAMVSSRNIEQKKGLGKVNQDTINFGRQKLVSAYLNSGLGKRPSYRFNDRLQYRRFSNGAMERALNNPAMYSSDNSRIFFLDRKKMDESAAQWYRLNFGTKPGRNTDVDPINMFGTPIKKSPSLASFPLSPAFTMPEGIWSSTFSATTSGTTFAAPAGRGKDAFYAIGARKKRPREGNGQLVQGRKAKSTNQIVGRSFIDEALGEMNRYYGERLEFLITDWVLDYFQKTRNVR